MTILELSSTSRQPCFGVHKFADFGSDSGEVALRAPPDRDVVALSLCLPSSLNCSFLCQRPHVRFQVRDKLIELRKLAPQRLQMLSVFGLL